MMHAQCAFYLFESLHIFHWIKFLMLMLNSTTQQFNIIKDNISLAYPRMRLSVKGAHPFKIEIYHPNITARL